MLRNIRCTLAICLVLMLPGQSWSHGPADVIDMNLGAAENCWVETSDQDKVYRQSNLLIAQQNVEVDCSIPAHNNKNLRHVSVMLMDIGGFTAGTECRVNSVSPLTNNARPGKWVKPQIGLERAIVKLDIPRRAYKRGFWAVYCKLDAGSVIHGIRFIYR